MSSAIEVSNEHRAPPMRLAHLRLSSTLEAHQAAQHRRLLTGRRIQAAVEGKPPSSVRINFPELPEVWSEEQRAPALADLFVAIRAGRSDGPVPLLGRVYRKHWNEEARYRNEVVACLADHPAWEWLRQVKGLSPLPIAQLLVRLDVEKAETISAFWAYCGLATVPGVEYRCADCGLVAAAPRGQPMPRTHPRLGEKRQCSGALLPATASAVPVRVAQPKPEPGASAAYDRIAQRLCHAIGISLEKAKGPYWTYFRDELTRLEREKPQWAPARRQATAARKTEKLFLAHLWLVWRKAVGLRVTNPEPRRENVPVVDPWMMLRGGSAPRRG
jgi:hypothetical protein